MALSFASYAAPAHPRAAAVLAVLALTTVNYLGVQKSAWLTRVIVFLTLVTLTVVVVACLSGGTASAANLAPFPGAGPRQVLQAAALLFFAFAGYARVATLGEEVRDPVHTIPRAVTVALLLTLTVYVVVAVSALLAVGAGGLAATSSPLRAAVAAGSWAGLSPAVRVGAAIAALGSLLALVLGVSRTTLAMARNHDLPHALAAVHPRYRVPHRAELVVGGVVVVLVATLDLRGAIGFSSFGVLTYYAIANAAALTLTAAEHRPVRAIPVLGLVGCGALAFSLPLPSVLSGAAVLLLGVATWAVRHRGRKGS